MTPAVMNAVIEGITESVAEHVGGLETKLAEALARIAELERKWPNAPKDGADGQPGKDGADGKDGTSVTLEQLLPMVQRTVADAVAGLPVPEPGLPGKDGTDGKDAEVDMTEVREFVSDAVTRQLADWPRPKDGTSVTLEDVAPVIQAEVTKAVEALPKPKDPVGLVGALIDRAGDLIVTLSDGSTKNVGGVVGRDGRDVDMMIVGQTLEAAIKALPVPKDGKDGLGFEDLAFELDEHGRTYAVYSRGETVRRHRVISITDQGVYREGTPYLRGDGVTYSGSFWIAQADTSEKPGNGPTSWRLAVKRGEDGKPGKKGEDGKSGPQGPQGRPGHDLR